MRGPELVIVINTAGETNEEVFGIFLFVAPFDGIPLAVATKKLHKKVYTI